MTNGITKGETDCGLGMGYRGGSAKQWQMIGLLTSPVHCGESVCKNIQTSLPVILYLKLHPCCPDYIPP